MYKTSIYKLMKLFPNAHINYIRILVNGEKVWYGAMEKCPKEYLHKQIAEMSIGEAELKIYF